MTWVEEELFCDMSEASNPRGEGGLTKISTSFRALSVLSLINTLQSQKKFGFLIGSYLVMHSEK